MNNPQDFGYVDDYCPVSLLIDFSSFRYIYYTNIPKLLVEYNLYATDIEPLYDWLVCNAFNEVIKTLYGARVYLHYRHDVYLNVYDNYRKVLENEVNRFFSRNPINPSRKEDLKMLVAGGIVHLVYRHD